MTTTAEIRERHNFDFTEFEETSDAPAASLLIDAYWLAHVDRGILLDRLEASDGKTEMQFKNNLVLIRKLESLELARSILDEGHAELLSLCEQQKQTIAAVSELPDRWRGEELASRTATPDDPQAMDGDDCADELQAQIKWQCDG